MVISFILPPPQFWNSLFAKLLNSENWLVLLLVAISYLSAIIVYLFYYGMYTLIDVLICQYQWIKKKTSIIVFYCNNRSWMKLLTPTTTKKSRTKEKSFCKRRNDVINFAIWICAFIYLKKTNFTSLIRYHLNGI